MTAAMKGAAPAGGASGSEALVREILQGLADGRFAPGQRLSEPDMMARSGLGRSTVREALGKLAAAGMVVQTPHRGAQIRLLSRREASDVLRVTELLLGLTARQAADAVAAGADPTALREAAMAYEAAAPLERPRARARYYRALTAVAGNAELERLLPMLQVHLIRAQLRGYRPPERDGRVAMVAAIVAGQADPSEAAARAQIRDLIGVLPVVPDTVFADKG